MSKSLKRYEHESFTTAGQMRRSLIDDEAACSDKSDDDRDCDKTQKEDDDAGSLVDFICDDEEEVQSQASSSPSPKKQRRLRRKKPKILFDFSDSDEEPATDSTSLPPERKGFTEKLFATYLMPCGPCKQRRASQIFVTTDNCMTFFDIRCKCEVCEAIKYI